MRAIARALAERHARETEPASGSNGPMSILQRWHDANGALLERGHLSNQEGAQLAARFGPTPGRTLDRLLARPDPGYWRRVGGLDTRRTSVRGRKAQIEARTGGTFSDVSEDVASLSAPLRAAGRPDLAEQLLAAYALASDDYGLYGLVDFFESLIACESALKLTATEARASLAPWLATPSDASRSLIVLTGGVASGKTTLAKALVRRMAIARIEADRVRRAVLEQVEEAAGALVALDRAWSHSFDTDAYASLLQRAEAVLASGRSCIIDSCTPKASARLRAAEAAERHGAELVLCTCVSSPIRSVERLRARDARDGVEAGTWEQIAAGLAARYEPIADDEPGRHIYVRTETSRADGVAAVFAALGPLERPPGSPRLTRRGRRPRAVTFDCWNTLMREADWHRAHALRVDALVVTAREAGADPARDRSEVTMAFDRAWMRHMQQWREGIHSGAREVARWSLEYLGVPLADPVVDHLTELFQSSSHSGRVVALEGARDTLVRLHEAGVAMALVCDTGLTPGRVVRQHLGRLGLLELLQAQLFSDEIGVPKPDARIYRAALGALGAPADSAVHVGDLRRTDVAGARALGMGSIRLRQAHDDGTRLPEADAVADTHPDIPALLSLD